MSYSFSYTTPVVEFEYTTSFLIMPRKGLEKNGTGVNVLHKLKICDKSIGVGEGVVHDIPALDTTLPLLLELTNKQYLPTTFETSYFYLCRDGAENINKYVTYYAISPTVSVGEFGKHHVLPARFHKTITHTKRDGRMSQCVFIQNNNIVLEYFFKSTSNLLESTKDDIASLKSVLDEKQGNVLKDFIASLDKSGHVQTFCQIVSYNKDKDGSLRISLKMKVKCFRYFWGEYIHLLPFPEFPKAGTAPRTGVLLGIGDMWWCDNKYTAHKIKREECWDRSIDLWKQIEGLNHILLGNSNQTVLVTGEPGSGKEGFSKAIHFGSIRKKTGETGIKTRSVANMSSSKLYNLLCGQVIDGVRIPGLIEEARGGTLFLDEIDKIKDAEFYSEFLRILEAGEYVPNNSATVEKVEDVNWIFAGAFTGQNNSNTTFDLPMDFWSRLTARIDIKNPIKLPPLNPNSGDKKIIISYSGALFVYFLLREAAKLSGSIDDLMAATKNVVFPSDYAQKLVGICNNSKSNICFDVSYITEIIDSFQKKIDNGIYRCCKKKDQYTERIEYYWCRCSVKYNAKKCPVAREECKYAYDSVRAIIKAALVAFTDMKNNAMTLNEFWRVHQNRPFKLEHRERATKKAAEIVLSARPGVFNNS